MILSLTIGCGGWFIHLYTLIRSYWSDNKWVVRVSFNDYHEAIPELFVFSGVIIMMIVTMVVFIVYLIPIFT